MKIRRIIIKKKLAEMKSVLVVLEKNINNVMELKFEVIFKYFFFLILTNSLT